MALNENQAVAIAQREGVRLGMPAAFQPRYVELRVIEVVMDGQPLGDRMPTPGMVRDLAVYVVRLGLDASEAELAIDAKTGELVRFRRSRS